eukprot:11169502-Lingulodinium_polyedra.AAC.1
MQGVLAFAAEGAQVLLAPLHWSLLCRVVGWVSGTSTGRGGRCLSQCACCLYHLLVRPFSRGVLGCCAGASAKQRQLLHSLEEAQADAHVGDDEELRVPVLVASPGCLQPREPTPERWLGPLAAE